MQFYYQRSEHNGPKNFLKDIFSPDVNSIEPVS